MAVRIGELLLKEKLITAEQLQQALTQQKANGGKLGYNLVKMGFVKDEQITALLSKQYGVPAISLAQFKIDPTIVKLVPTETARKYQMIPLSRAGSTLTIYSSMPLQGAAGPQNQAAVNGAKLALKQAGGKVGKYTINYVPLDSSTAAAGSPYV